MTAKAGVIDDIQLLMWRDPIQVSRENYLMFSSLSKDMEEAIVCHRLKLRMKKPGGESRKMHLRYRLYSIHWVVYMCIKFTACSTTQLYLDYVMHAIWKNWGFVICVCHKFLWYEIYFQYILTPFSLNFPLTRGKV